MEKDQAQPVQQPSIKEEAGEGAINDGQKSSTQDADKKVQLQAMEEKAQNAPPTPIEEKMDSGPLHSNIELVKQLVDMGFKESLAKRAVEQTSSLEEAANLILIMEENESGNICAPTKAQVKELHYKMVVKK